MTFGFIHRLAHERLRFHHTVVMHFAIDVFVISFSDVLVSHFVCHYKSVIAIIEGFASFCIYM